MSALMVEMTASDFALWRAFYAEMPDREEHYLSQLCAMVGNGLLKRPDGKPFSPADFRPDFRSAADRIRAEQRFVADQAAFDAIREKAVAGVQTEHAMNGTGAG